MNRDELIESISVVKAEDLGSDLPTWVHTLILSKAIEERTVLYKSSRSGYLSEDDLSFKSPEDAISYFTQLLNVEPHQIEAEGNYTTTFWNSPDFKNFFISTTETRKDGIYLNLKLWTPDKSNILEFQDKTKKLKQRVRNSINVISSSRRGFELKSIGTIDEDFISENYEDSVVEGFNYLVKEFNAENPKGRFAILDGPPGTGKTYFVRSLLTQMNSSINVILPARLVQEVDGPALIELLVNEKSSWRNLYYDEGDRDKSILLVIEDADDCLVPRGTDNMSMVSSLLNLTDGIFGSALDIRILATTNAKNTQIDAALRRPGRLCRGVQIREITAERASKIYYRLTGKEKDYDEPTTLAQVYADAYDVDQGVVASSKPKRLGFGAN